MVYIHMNRDLFETTVICNECKQGTFRSEILKDGFTIRCWKCDECRKEWLHPGDLEEYKQFIDIKRKEFEVKLRLVGNSWSVSIPKEIIRFEEVNETKIIKMSMEEPGKLSIFFQRVRRTY